jgi:hypothetical protein
MSGKEINNNEAFAASYAQLPEDVKDRLSFKNTESREDWQTRRRDAKPMATPWFNQGVTIMGPAGYFVAETQINREHARVDTYLALANAEFIVKAVNDYDALKSREAVLVEALRDARRALECAINAAWEAATPGDVSDNHVIKKIDAALAQVPK